MNGLKNCPFCGEEGVLNSTKEFSNREYASVHCSKCLVKTMVFSTEKKAIKAWNNRTIEHALLEAVNEIVSKLSYYKNEYGISEYDTDIILDSINLIAKTIQGEEPKLANFDGELVRGYLDETSTTKVESEYEQMKALQGEQV